MPASLGSDRAMVEPTTRKNRHSTREDDHAGAEERTPRSPMLAIFGVIEDAGAKVFHFCNLRPPSIQDTSPPLAWADHQGGRSGWLMTRWTNVLTLIPCCDFYSCARSHHRCWTARPPLDWRWPSRLVATASRGVSGSHIVTGGVRALGLDAALTRIFRGPSSAASPRVIASTAPLVPE